MVTMASTSSSPESISPKLRNPSYGSDTDSDSSDTTCNSSSASSGEKDHRPAHPYIVGATFKLKSHVPGEPFGYGYENKASPHRKENWQRLPQVEYCLDRQPIAGEIHESDTQSIEITSRIRTGYHGGAQVVVVKCKGQKRVAKIYDPLYYQGYLIGCRLNVVGFADADYAHEAAAYDALKHSDEARQYIPQYHGSWIMEVKTPVPGEKSVERTRQVCLILLEFIKGTTMSKINPKRRTDKERNNILRKVIEAESHIHHAGVIHNDLAPRNIILIGSDFQGGDFGVVIVDFDKAVLLKMIGIEPMDKTLMDNPVGRYWGQMHEFESTEWVSYKDHESEEWLWRHFKKSEKYVQMLVDKDGELLKDEHGYPMMQGEQESEGEE